ncbi:hypothetical protein phiAS5_ORF0035 [Aeromonas phage phiAS5]|uniref:Uncharacterized protein n=1 Tax=Aeromonas phage phiAS5 TaxID=879630 RepID=E1A2D2_9CAUD|nr:hypothetical protein phiAS5_ORF0035 [Aeromonas phage phiAS5]ADM79878.1 hypothetical protein phiAS5_ORF0035 [Aeromonas phage phiAS5]BES53016.1 hypothetical protein [Aeromonas phage phiWae14]
MVDPQDYGLLLFGVGILVVMGMKAAFDVDTKRSNDERSAKNFLRKMLDAKSGQGIHFTKVRPIYSNRSSVKNKGFSLQEECQDIGHINSNRNKKRKKRK